MLTRTFCHIPGLGGHTERELWRQGCTDWQRYREDPERFGLGQSNSALVSEWVERSVAAYDSRHHQFFAEGLAAREAWRAWPEFRDSCVYLDIETDGGTWGSSVTTIGLYDGNTFECLVKGESLENFRDAISRYSMIVTFFGTGFDLPMLRKAFPGIEFDQIHLDLCYALKRLGFRGGLKKIERQLGIARGDDTDGLTGLDAIRLWREFRAGNDKSLETLIAYNRDDVINLETLAQLTYDRMKAATLREAGLCERDGELAELVDRLL